MNLLLISALLFVASSLYLESIGALRFLAKLQSAVDSGRFEIWRSLLDVSFSDYLILLFGMGPNSFSYGQDLSAHNSYLQLLHDYGLIASIAIILFFVHSTIKLYWRGRDLFNLASVIFLYGFVEVVIFSRVTVLFILLALALAVRANTTE
jgi:hypothetical protein